MPATISSLEMVQRLIEFDTTSSKSNLSLIEFIADYLDGYGVSCVLVESDDGSKANLIASVGPDVEGGVVLSGHTDVVPVAGQDWSRDPFRVVEDSDRLYARGSADMKSFIALALALVPEFVSRRLVRPIHFALSYDEEIGCLGAPRLISRLMEVVPSPQAVIVGEPTEMKVVGAHRGASLFTTRIAGRPGHSSQPGRGVNAIEHAAACIGFLGGVAKDFRDSADADETRFDPPHATLSVGVIEGGTATNIIAEHCHFSWGCRAANPQTTEDTLTKLNAYANGELLPVMKTIAPEASVETESGPRVPPLVSVPGSSAEVLGLSLTGQNSAATVALASEAGMFQAAGIPAILCGPGSPRQAHQADEFVELAEFVACEKFLRGVGEWASQAPSQP